MRTTPVVLCLLLIASAAAHAQEPVPTPSTATGPAVTPEIAPTAIPEKLWPLEPDGFKGVPFGTPKAEMLTAFPGLRYCRDTPTITEPKTMCLIDPYLVGTARGKLYFFFDLTGFTGVVFYFHPDDFDFMVEVAETKYGSPQNDTTTPVQNRMGATFENRRLTWRGSVASVGLTKYTDSLDRSGLYVNTIASMEERKNEDESAKKKAADQL